jgi:DNA mismatch endonuclease (patch repair protein)
MDSRTPGTRSENMRRIRSADTAPELRVRRLVHAMGYRYRLHKRELPGKPDIVFSSKKKVILVHGCFWHAHRRCKIARVPKSNTHYWIPKLLRNTNRDAAVRKLLKRAGWEALVIWECETRDSSCLGKRIARFLESTPYEPNRLPQPRFQKFRKGTPASKRRGG